MDQGGGPVGTGQRSSWDGAAVQLGRGGGPDGTGRSVWAGAVRVGRGGGPSGPGRRSKWAGEGGGPSGPGRRSKRAGAAVQVGRGGGPVGTGQRSSWDGAAVRMGRGGPCGPAFVEAVCTRYVSGGVVLSSSVSTSSRCSRCSLTGACSDEVLEALQTWVAHAGAFADAAAHRAAAPSCLRERGADSAEGAAA